MKQTRYFQVTTVSKLTLALACAAILQSPKHNAAAEFQLQHGALPDENYVYHHALIRNDATAASGPLADVPQGNADLLIGTKAETSPGAGDQGELRSLLEFDLSPIVAGIGGSSILGATLNLQHLPTGQGLPRIDGTPKVDVYEYGFDVSRDTSTWNDPDGDGSPFSGDTTPGGTLGAFINTFGELNPADGLLSRTIDSTPAFVSAVQNALNGDQILRLILVEDDPDLFDRDIAFFYGNDTRSPAVLPLLTITTDDAQGLLGDYNGDDVVDAADYVVWRKNLGTTITLLNEDPSVTPNEVTPEDFGVWRSHFGESLPGAGGSFGHAVPEPSAITLSMALVAFAAARRRRSIAPHHVE